VGVLRGRPWRGRRRRATVGWRPTRASIGKRPMRSAADLRNPERRSAADSGDDTIEFEPNPSEDSEESIEAFWGANPNLPMTQLSADQIHDRLTARWSSQIVQVTLMAGIHMSLMFGSEFVNLDFTHAGDERVVKTIYVYVSVFSVIGDFQRANCLIQLIADIGRVLNHRMTDVLTQNPGITSVEWHLMVGELMGLTQLGMAIFALEPWALPALPMAYVYMFCVTVMPGRGAASKARLHNHYGVYDPESGEELHVGWNGDGKSKSSASASSSATDAE
jgi:hypothetical protein